MIVSTQLKNWFAKFKKYTVRYKQGFFHLSNLSNSPHSMLDSFDKLPFIKHNRQKKYVNANTLFIHARFYYAEPEPGLWMLVAELDYKKNMIMHNIYDPELPMDYNFISLHCSQKSLTNTSALVNGMALNDKTWTLFKPGHAHTDCHFKGAHEFHVTVYFTNEWLAKKLKSKSYFNRSNLDKFFKSDNRYIFLADKSINNERFYSDFLSLLESNGDHSRNGQITDLIDEFFEQFIAQYNYESINEDYFKLSDKDRKCIQKTEKYLLDNLLRSFPGVENVAKKAGISPTKLKRDFKVVHNQSLYQYYRHHQMHLANKLLIEKGGTVKEVAGLLGYSNAGKFAAVFKEQFGIQPSSLIKHDSSK